MPETHYATIGDDNVAYQVVGDGPIDILWQSGFTGHVEAHWEFPRQAKFLRQLASFSRLILFDKRGTGLSDPVPLTALPTLEEWMDDARVVMDAVGSERATLVAGANSGPMFILFAATYPQRTSGLVLFNSYARFRRAEDYPWGAPQQVAEDAVEFIKKHWGTGMILASASPSMALDDEALTWWGRYERQSATPRAAAAMFRMMFQVDVRDALKAIRAPTLVLGRKEASFFRIGHSRYLAEQIPNSQLVELPGSEEAFITPELTELMLTEIQDFVTGVRPTPQSDRVLATVLFTDLVDSTARAAELGDHQWTDLLRRHREITRRELASHRGHEVNTTGDGFIATFDGPARAITCAQAIADRVRALGLELRAGLHTGECELIGDDVGGIAVHIAARVAALAQPGEVLVSSTVKDLVAGSGIRFLERGNHALKGVPDEWRLYAVEA